MKLLTETSLAHADILAFVDNNPINHGKILHGKAIIQPQNITKSGRSNLDYHFAAPPIHCKTNSKDGVEK